jgi:gliding motility-associated-like protein/uncharacterized repeat protein (TIGR01451 family)
MGYKQTLGCFLLFSMAFIPFLSVHADEGFNIIETFKEDTSENFMFGGEPVAYLTSGKDDPSGNGWLRLTHDHTYQKGYAVIRNSFVSGLGVLIDLEFKTWRINRGATNAGADGFSIFMFDATVDPFNIGGFGGSLGYAPYVNGANSYPGLSGGYFGVGIDEYGNFSNPTEGRTGGTGKKANTIGIRGPASSNYNWLTGVTNPGFSLQSARTTERPSDTTYYRRFQIEITPDSIGGTKKYTITVRAKTSLNGLYQLVLAPYTLPTLPPQKLKIGFAASTGADVNFHELRTLYITTTGGLRITKSVDKPVARVGEELTYRVDLYNLSKDTLSGLHFSDALSQLTPAFQVQSVTFNNDGTASNTATGYSLTNLSNASVRMVPSSHSSFVIQGKIVQWPSSGLLSNTAVFNTGTSGLVDENLTNDTASVSTTVIDPKISLVKKADKTNFEAAGEVIHYNLTVKNIGNGSLKSIKVSDPMLTDSATYLSGDLNANAKLDVNEEWLYSASYTVTNADVAVGLVRNSAYVRGFDVLGNAVVDTSGLTQNDNEPTVVAVKSKEFFIPNVITPNGDGANDVFEIVGLKQFTNAELNVFNRWGNQVYHNANYNNDWDGNGLNDGTYYYIIGLKNTAGTHTYKGWVLLKRN